MTIPDLLVLPAGHPPSPYPFPPPIGTRDGETTLGELPKQIKLCAVGWLGHEVTASGEVAAECVDLLVDAYDSKLVFSDGTMGWHDCEICTTEEQRRPGGKIGPVVRWRGRELRLYGHGHHLVRLGDVVYMCPVLILHYVLDHGYQPPREFLKAVADGRFLTTNDLVPSSETAHEWREKLERAKR